MTAVVTCFAWVIIGLLVVLFARRVLVLAASLLPRRSAQADTSRSIVLLVAARNEAAHLPALLSAIARLEYPADLVQLVLISDGSTDETASIMEQWTDGPFHREVMVLPDSLGKGGALAAGLARAAESDLVVVLDADCVPQPDALRWLAGAFADEHVGAATGYPRPSNADVSTTARYAALERWVHHLVWLAGKDRLALDPSVIGVLFAVRRRALVQAGGFPVGRLTEDIDLSSALVAAGWRLRWIGEAVAREDVVTVLPAFVAQRNRWARGLLQGAPRARSWEQVFVALGYLDRVVFVAAVLLASVGTIAIWWPLGYVIAPVATVLVAMRHGGARRPVAILSAAVVMTLADIAVTLRAFVGQLRASRVDWGRRTER